jgi:hypothetical protein
VNEQFSFLKALDDGRLRIEDIKYIYGNSVGEFAGD